MNEVLTWGTLIGAATALVTVAKFWMDMGELRRQAQSAESIAHVAVAKAELVTTLLAEYKVLAAQEFASIKDLAAAERRMADILDALRGDIGRLNDRLDRLLERMSED